MTRRGTLGRMVTLSALSVSLVALAGCFAASPLYSAMFKIATGQMDSLSGAEVKAVQEAFVPDLDLTDEQAEAIAEFLQLNDIQTLEDLQQVIQQAMEDPSSIELPEGFLDLFVDFLQNWASD